MFFFLEENPKVKNPIHISGVCSALLLNSRNEVDKETGSAREMLGCSQDRRSQRGRRKEVYRKREVDQC